MKAARVNNRICQVGMQQRSGKHYLQAKEGVLRYRKAGQDHAGAHLVAWQHVPFAEGARALQTKPSNLDWAHYLGPLKWRDYDPQQYYNWRAYLDFGGGQVTDLFTHWIDVVHMFMGQDIPVSAMAAAAFTTTRTADRAGYHQRAAAIPRRIHRDVRGDARSGHHGRSD